ncbi:MAG: spermidine synthase [Rhizobiaceae bacterium]|nr:spermidine synthase [Rhizobiaceae bacterium]
MSRNFEELDYCPTPIGALSLRRRLEPKTGEQVYEIKLGEEFLMSSMFTASEKALANLALKHHKGKELDVVVGGLGLGYSACAVLDHDKVGSLTVIDALEAVIGWHKSGLLPLGEQLTTDKRCTLQQDDFFKLALSEQGFGKKLDLILVDIDHSPEFFLDSANAAFYQPEGLTKMATHLKPGGMFALWSDELPDDKFTNRLNSVFAEAWAEPVTFFNPLQSRNFTQSVYIARKENP